MEVLDINRFLYLYFIKPTALNFQFTPRLFTLIFFLFIGHQLFAQPIISALSAYAGPAGSQLNITGSGFSNISTQNKVYFGGAIAQVSAASSTSLTVTVPFGAGFAPVSVTVNGLTGYSRRAFVSTFISSITIINSTSFTEGPSYNTALTPIFSRPSSPVAADFDGDGKVDLVTGNSGDNLLTFLHNKSANSLLYFEPSALRTSPGGIDGLVFGDLDSDGKPDLAAISSENKLSLFRNISTAGEIRFDTRIDITTNNGQFDIAMGDLDLDGLPDIIISNHNSNIISVYKNLSTIGNINFASKIDISTGTGPIGVTIGDLDNDNKPEIVVSNSSNQTLSIFRNLSTSNNIIIAPRIDLPTGMTPVDVAIGDVDNDGMLDIVCANYISQSFSFFKNTGVSSISFAAKVDFTTFVFPQSISLGDINGDGKLEVVTANYSGSASISHNVSTMGTVSFVSTLSLNNNNPAKGIVINDLDYDGRPEVVIGTHASGSDLKIFRNIIGRPTISAINPNSGGRGDTINIIGANFIGANAVTIGGKDATSFTIVNDNSISAVVANASALNTEVLVTGPTGFGSFNHFDYLGPLFDDFSPKQGGRGCVINISGINFLGTNSVTFGGLPAASFIVNNNESITAIVDSGATGFLEVNTNKGSMLTDSIFTFLSLPAISNFIPTNAGIGDTVQISGTGFSSTHVVKFGNIVASSFITNSDSSITAIVGTGASGKVAVSTLGGVDSLSGFIFTGPSIYSFSPAYAHAGDTIIIRGRNLISASAVVFGSEAASSFNVINDSTIMAIVSNGSSGLLQVTTPNGTATIPGFSYTGPVITSFTPTVSSTSRTVTIFGSNLSNPTSVSFGGVPSPQFSQDSVGNIQAWVGSGSSGNVVINTPTGTATKAGFIFAEEPVITDVTPPIGGNGTVITIKGRHLSNIEFINLGGVELPDYTVSGDTLINVTINVNIYGYFVPNIIVGTAGGIDIFYDFVFIKEPTIQSFSPLIGGVGTEVMIKGSHFTTANAIYFGDSAAASFQVLSDTSISAIVGNGASGSIKVHSIGGIANSTGFNFISSPIIESFSPSIGSIGEKITIRGQNLTGTTAVIFGDMVAQSFSVANDTLLTATIGNGSSGFIKVISAYGIDSTAGFSYKERPFITNFNPQSGAVGTVVTITGNHFNPTAQNNTVFFGAAKAIVTSATSTSLTVVVPPGASQLPISVTVNALTAYSAKHFAITFEGGGGRFSANTFNNNYYKTGLTAPLSVTLADVDKDGKTDVVNNHAYSLSNSGISVFRNNSTVGQLIFADHIKYNGGFTNELVAADFDGDGWLDIAGGGQGDFGALNIYENNGAGGFLNVQVFPHNALAYFTIAVGDIDTDGKPDVVLLSSNSQHIIIMRNISVGGIIQFETQPIIVAGGIDWGLKITDLDGDNKPEIIFSSTAAQGVGVLRNLSTPGNIVFANKINMPMGGKPANIAVADIDRDGKTDITSVSGTMVRVIRNTSSVGNLSFETVISYPYGNNASFIDVADVDGDSKPEILIPYNGNLAIFRNTSNPGAINFEQKTDVAGFNYAYSVSVGDLDGDGKPDLAVTNLSGSEVSLLRNQVGEIIVIDVCPPSPSVFLEADVAGNTYQWQADDGNGFINISDNQFYSGSNTRSLILSSIPTTFNNYKFRCMVDGVIGYSWRIRYDYTWTGAANNEWENPSNWSCGVAPDANSIVVINSGNIFINSNSTIRSLTVAPGASVTVMPGRTLTITN